MCHVLIIEDEFVIAIAIQMVLEDEGATSFDFAVTETEAVTAAFARRPGLITSDVMLLEGTGPLAVRRIHDQLGEIPVHFITGTPNDCRACRWSHVILNKPIQERSLREAFRRLAKPLA